MAKNCNTCRYLAWHDDEDTDGNTGANSGYGCDKRAPTGAAEQQMLADLASEEYRNRYKRCFEPKEATHG
jgi:hypothetical protein